MGFLGWNLVFVIKIITRVDPFRRKWDPLRKQRSKSEDRGTPILEFFLTCSTRYIVLERLSDAPFSSAVQ